MAHHRNRFLIEALNKALQFSPLVGLLGHRQVGKTTLLQEICEEYITFDDEDEFKKAQKNAKLFLSELKKSKTALDECQYLPSLFPALKERVRINKKTGQFLLSGSVRFTSRKAIQESLTGRITNLELLPLSISEICQKQLPDTALRLLQSSSAESFADSVDTTLSSYLKMRKDRDLYLTRGGLPGVSFIRDPNIRTTRIKDQLSTILDRDLRMVYNTRIPFHQIINLLSFFAEHEGRPFTHSRIEQELRLTESTQKHLLHAFESIFLIRSIPVEGRKTHDMIYFEDQAEFHHLGGRKTSTTLQLEGLLYRNIRIQFFYRLGIEASFFHYLTRGKARVPVAIRTNIGILGFIVIENELPTLSEKYSADSFLKTYQDAKLVYVSPNRKKIEILSKRTLATPIELFL